jgi:hypothetical protein
VRIWWRPEGGVMVQNSGTIGALALVRKIPVAGKGKVILILFN